MSLTHKAAQILGISARNRLIRLKSIGYMRQLLLKTIIIITCIVLVASCDRKVCPAYQSTFLIGEGDAEEYFSYFSSFDSLPKDDGIFRSRGKTKNGLVKRKVGPTLLTMFSRSEFENRYNFPKAISTKNYVPDTTGMATEDSLALAKPEKKGLFGRKKKRDREKEEETTAVEDTGIMDEGNIAEDFAEETNTITPVVADESTGEIVPADSVAKDTTEFILKFTDQLIYESLFGDPTEKAASDSTAVEEEPEKEKKGLFGLFGKKKDKKKKKDRNKNSIFNISNKDDDEKEEVEKNDN